MSSPPGWYPNPSGEPGSRLYWDGAQWRGDVAPVVHKKSMTYTKYLLWVALAGFLVMNGARTGLSEGTQIGAAISSGGFILFVGGLIGAASTAIGARMYKKDAQQDERPPAG